MSVSSVHFRFCILSGVQTSDYLKMIYKNMNLLGIGIGREKDLIIGWLLVNNFISCILKQTHNLCFYFKTIASEKYKSYS